MNENKIDLNLATLLPEIDLERDECVRRLERAMQNQPGISKAHIIEPAPASALCLHIDPAVLSPTDARRLAERISSKITDQYRHLQLSVEGMDCSDCALVIEHAIGRMPGVLNLSVDYPQEEIWIEFDSRQVTKSEVESQIRKLGYDVPRSIIFQFWEDKKAFILSGIAGITLLLGWIRESRLSLPDWTILLAYSASYAAGGLPLLRESITQLMRERRFDTDQLMILAAIGTLALGAYAEGAFLLFLFSLGHALENQALSKATHAINSLKDLAPKSATVRRDSEVKAIPIHQIRLEDIVIVSPGSRIPVDGHIRSGTSTVNQSQVTGESLPVEVGPGHTVFAGSVNGNGALELTATRLAKDSTVAKIAQLVEQARAEKAPSERFSNRVMRVLIPAVLIGDMLLIAIPPLFGVPFNQSFRMAMILLVAASPCALALGTPSAVLAALAHAARQGILIKGGGRLETLAAVQKIAFDKTGTLSTGDPTVTDIVPVERMGVDQLLSIAAAVEMHSTHPLAAAIVAKANAQSLSLPIAKDISSEPGFGVSGEVREERIRIGKFTEADRSGVSDELKSKINLLEGSGKTLVAITNETKLLGVLALADQIRPGAKSALEALHHRGVDELMMLTGDQPSTAKTIGDELGMDQVYANLSPEDKLDIVSSISSGGEVVCMIGDGVNDAPALSRASVGIAMGGARNQVALDTADIVLMSDDLGRLPYLIDLSRQTLSIIRQNFVIAFGVILGLITLTLVNVTTIALAILLHEGSTLLVVLNALRLLSFKARSPIA